VAARGWIESLAAVFPASPRVASAVEAPIELQPPPLFRLDQVHELAPKHDPTVVKRPPRRVQVGAVLEVKVGTPTDPGRVRPGAVSRPGGSGSEQVLSAHRACWYVATLNTQTGSARAKTRQNMSRKAHGAVRAMEVFA
jgi:hypothetical protein